MHYLLFNNGIYISDGEVVKKVEKVPEIEQARLCCVDVDVMIASAPQDHLDKKDSLLAQKFAELYSNEYITISEKIGNNIFQVMGIKSERIKDIYSLIPGSGIETFVPYAIAIRGLMTERQVDMSRTIVFVDDLGAQEKLITVFDGLRFSRTRTLNSNKAEDILPDIRRSPIDFNKKSGVFTGHQSTGDLTVIINNKELFEGIKFLDPGISIEFFECQYPALEGLKFTDTPLKYRLPEEIILERKKKELRSRLRHSIIAVSIGLMASVFFGFNQIIYSFTSRDLQAEKSQNAQLRSALNRIDQQIYRDYLKKSKYLDYSSIFFEISGLLPVTYEVSSFKFSAHKDRWIFDTYIFAQDDQFYDEIPRNKILKEAEIKDSFINDRPGKYLKVAL